MQIESARYAQGRRTRNEAEERIIQSLVILFLKHFLVDLVHALGAGPVSVYMEDPLRFFLIGTTLIHSA